MGAISLMAKVDKKNHYGNFDFGLLDDTKIQMVLLEFSITGIGYFFSLLCKMGQNKDNVIDISNERELKAYAHTMHCQVSEIKEFIKFAVEIGLFSKIDNNVYSERFKRQIEQVSDISKKRSEAVSTRYAKKNEPPKQPKVEVINPYSDDELTIEDINYMTPKKDIVKKNEERIILIDKINAIYGEIRERARPESETGKYQDRSSCDAMNFLLDIIYERCLGKTLNFEKESLSELKAHCSIVSMINEGFNLSGYDRHIGHLIPNNPNPTFCIKNYHNDLVDWMKIQLTKGIYEPSELIYQIFYSAKKL